jgi:hypothetical protein
MIICIRLILDTDVTQWIGQGLMVLFEAIANPRIDDEDKLLPTDIIGRLAHIPTGSSNEEIYRKRVFAMLSF